MLVPGSLASPRVSLNARVEMSFRRVHLVFLPEVLLEALDPFEVGDDHPAGVRQHVRDEHAPILEDVVGGRRRRAFAPSQTILALILSALSVVITCSSAHGASTSQSLEQLLVRDPFGSCRPASAPVSCLCAIAVSTSIPFEL